METYIQRDIHMTGTYPYKTCWSVSAHRRAYVTPCVCLHRIYALSCVHSTVCAECTHGGDMHAEGLHTVCKLHHMCMSFCVYVPLRLCPYVKFFVCMSPPFMSLCMYVSTVCPCVCTYHAYVPIICMSPSSVCPSVLATNPEQLR